MFVHEPTKGVTYMSPEQPEQTGQRAWELARTYTPISTSDACIQAHMALSQILESEAMLMHWTAIMQKDIEGTLQLDESDFPESAHPHTEQEPTSLRICNIIDSIACRLYEGCSIFWEENHQLRNDTCFPLGRAETLMAYAKYLQRISRQRHDVIRSGIPADLDDERIELRRRIAHLVRKDGAFHIDIGSRFSFSTDPNPKLLAQIVDIARECNADLVELLCAHRYAVEHDKRVLWHTEEDIEIGKGTYGARNTHNNWMTLEQWIYRETKITPTACDAELS